MFLYYLLQNVTSKERNIQEMENELERLRAVNKDLCKFAANEILNSKNKVS